VRRTTRYLGLRTRSVGAPTERTAVGPRPQRRCSARDGEQVPSDWSVHWCCGLGASAVRSAVGPRPQQRCRVRVWCAGTRRLKAPRSKLEYPKKLQFSSFKDHALTPRFSGLVRLTLSVQTSGFLSGRCPANPLTPSKLDPGLTLAAIYWKIGPWATPRQSTTTPSLSGRSALVGLPAKAR